MPTKYETTIAACQDLEEVKLKISWIAAKLGARDSRYTAFMCDLGTKVGSLVDYVNDLHSKIEEERKGEPKWPD